ncbi:YbhB/YbcL family Raf kinase inhibitor-like protein [Advenella sp. WQ 585]|uniref:YbhB/YbcL family Raf kinase inhibitor-like protein n=1 Tax=Advenella mandrilli TaxID=2800330 RepID=A0ABS1EDA0_9BURK|nr:YbhB/YbcL family Raf kinase inhibitor-like protein [Advenella mandrilli]MBK1780863.1 YbhB/YbcL family Raf kinase inhibitor-like protein [Advenella mandrilli]
MKLLSQSIVNGQAIHARFAFGKQDAAAHIALSDNLNPHFSWEGAPEGTLSFVLVCRDPDAPSKPDDVNQEDREVPADLPRANFYHWVLVDIPASVTAIEEGEFSKEVTPKGKNGPTAPRNMRQGINDYTTWFASDHDMKGDYYGYDGPCPPFNDALAHRYEFTLYALDIETVPLEGRFSTEDVLKVINPHILASDSITGLYTLNPKVTI